MSRIRLAAAMILGTAFVCAPLGAAAVEHSGDADGNEIVVTARNAQSVEAEAAAMAPELRTVEYRRSLPCGGTDAGVMATPLNGPCADYAPATQPIDCEGLDPVIPLWVRTRATSTDPWNPWALALTWTCPQDAMPELTLTDFARLPIAPPVLTIQPARPQVLVNMPTIVYTDPVTQAFITDLLGFPVEVEATPTTFTWDFGDSTDPVTTTSPGHPYPDHDVAHPYPRPGTYTITLTTTFTGTYRLAGTTTWLDVVGTATTTTTAPPITAIDAPTRLVAGDCTQHPTPSTC